MEGDELLDDVFSKAFDDEVAPPAVDEIVPPETVVPPEPEPVVAPPVVEVVPPVVVAPITVEDVSKAVKEALVVPAVAVVTPEIEDPKILEALADFKEQWPTQEIAVNSILSKALKAQETTLAAKFDEKLAAIEARITPLASTIQAGAAEQHMLAITTAHPDAQTIMPEVEAWISKQPKYLQKAYDDVIDNGSAADVVEFFTEYKAATGKVTPPPPSPSPKIDEGKLLRMEAPTTVRTSVSAEAEPDDFDSAFDAEAKKLKLAV